MLQNDSEFSFKIYPNPSCDVVNFNYYLPDNLFAELFILDLLGNIVYVSNLNYGFQNLVLKNLQQGIYFAEIIIDGKLQGSHKIIVSY